MEIVHNIAESNGVDELICVAADDFCNNLHSNNEMTLVSHLYEWLADSASTSHVANHHKLFHSFTPLVKSVNGVGNATVKAEGCGTVKLTSEINGQKYLLTLQNVLYIPNNTHNLFSLGCWDATRGMYTGGNDILQLYTKLGTCTLTRQQVSNNLYRLMNITPIFLSLTSSYPAITHVTHSKN